MNVESFELLVYLSCSRRDEIVMKMLHSVRCDNLLIEVSYLHGIYFTMLSGLACMKS
jgi:hypothetical protein